MTAPKRPDVVFTSDAGHEIVTDVITCCPVTMPATSNKCAHSATTIGAANAFGITSKNNAWKSSLNDLPHEFHALAHEPGRISDTANNLLDNLINRLHPNDRPRLRTYCYQLIAATTTLGVARVIRACLPIRCDSSHRVLPTPGDAIPSNGIPPRPPPGQYRRHLPTPHSTQPPPTPATPHSDSPESSPIPSINIFPPVRSVASAADRAFGGTVG